MKKIFFAILLLAGITSYGQNPDYLVSMSGIGQLKLDMKQADVEKILNKKLTVHLNNQDAWLDTVKTKYKNIDLTLFFEKVYVDDSVYNIGLMGIMSSNPLTKTKSGIGIGTDKMRLINEYETNFLRIAPDFTDDTYTTLSKTKSTIYVYDGESENTIVYHLTNKKVSSIEVIKVYGD